MSDMPTPQPEVATAPVEEAPNVVPQVQELIQEFLGMMRVEATIVPRISMGEDGEITVFALRTKDANLLIGQGGSNLQSLQHVLRLFVRSRMKEVPGIESFDFMLDVNNYRKEREGYLLRLAQETLRKVRDTKKEVRLKPMTSYERRIIHMQLSTESDVTTESAGGGRDRHIVVKPLFANDEDAVVSGSLVF